MKKLALPFSLPSFPFSPETPDTQANKKLITDGKNIALFNITRWADEALLLLFAVICLTKHAGYSKGQY